MKKWFLSFFVIACCCFTAVYKWTEFSNRREREANDHVFNAIYSFEKGDYDLALEGNANVDGFEQITRNYGFTDIGYISHFYAATCWLHKYDELQDRTKCKEGINHLQKFNSENHLFSSRKYILLGDLCVEYDDCNNARNYFKQACKESNNDVFKPMCYFKASLAQEGDGRRSETINTLKRLIEDFPDTEYGEKARQRLAAYK